MYKDRLNDCFIILALAHRMIDDASVRDQLKKVATTYKGIIKSNKKLTKKRVEKLEVYIETLPTFNKNAIIENGNQLLKKI